MNIYKLKSGEIESHVHESVSTSTLLAGQAIMSFNGNDYEMVLNEPITIPANTVHSMENTGIKECRIGCRCGNVVGG